MTVFAINYVRHIIKTICRPMGLCDSFERHEFVHTT